MYSMGDVLAFIHRIKKLYEKAFQPIAKEYGLSQIEIDVLLFLGNNPQYDTAKDIVEVRGLTKSYVSAAVDKLMKRDFLIREADGRDRRCVHLKLSPQTHSLVSVLQSIQQEFGRMLYRGMTEEETESLKGLMKQVDQNIKQALKR